MRERRASTRRGGLTWRNRILGFVRVSGLLTGSVAACLLSVAASSALAGMTGVPRAAPPPDFGIDWVTIGAPGNAPFPGPSQGPSTQFSIPVIGRGGVAQTFRMARTEITAGQWFDFVQAYGKFLPRDMQDDLIFTGGVTVVIGFDVNGDPIYQQPSENAKRGVVTIGWRFAARYANWLHNDKATNREAFETGAYDASTFGDVIDPSNGQLLGVTDNTFHLPGARVWIPSLDEWMKAVYYDPDKNGPGQGGWWQYPDAQDVPLTPGFPGEPGAQTVAGVIADLGTLNQFNVPGLFPDTSAPWGVLDASGTMSEWLEGGVFRDGLLTGRLGKGSTVLDRDSAMRFDTDNISFAPSGLSSHQRGALRLASVVPSPGTAAPFAVLLACAPRRRRRRG